MYVCMHVYMYTYPLSRMQRSRWHPHKLSDLPSLSQLREGITREAMLAKLEAKIKLVTVCVCEYRIDE